MTRRQFPIKRIPSNPITPHGSYWLLSGKKPMMTYRSYDGTIVFHLMGGMAIPDPYLSPECVSIKELSGLIAPWAPIEQKGATQDGNTFVDALYDPIDGDMTVQLRGKTPQRTARLLEDWIAAWDARKPGELSFFDQHAGRWWAPVRWTRNPVDKLRGGNFTTQTFQWPFKSHDAFWRSYDSVDEFRYGNPIDLDDDFADLDAWTLQYSGSGNGTMIATTERTGLLATIFGPGKNEVGWQLGNNDQGRTVVAQRTGYTTDSNLQVAYMKFGTLPEWTFWDEAYNDIWLRMDNDGTPGQTGVRLRIQRHNVELSYFIGGVETELRNKRLLVPPQPHETWSVIAGYDGDSRTFRVLRGRLGLAEVMTVKENGTGSPLGADYRGMGFGMESGTGLLRELKPGNIARFWGGDNAVPGELEAVSGMLTRWNAGDQPMWDRYTLYGPGTFYIASGPGSVEYVKFGPLERNQVVQLRSDPRKRGVVDLTSVPPSPQQQQAWEGALSDFLSFASGNNVVQLEGEARSRFGVKAPQGNMYSLLEGRFATPIPPKPAAGPIKPYNVLVRIAGGDADSRIVAAGTPLRRWPL